MSVNVVSRSDDVGQRGFRKGRGALISVNIVLGRVDVSKCYIKGC